VFTDIAIPRARGFRFAIGHFYRKNNASSTWAFRLAFTYAAENATVEEDVAPFAAHFECVPKPGLEVAITTPTGRALCYLPAELDSEARYYANGLLYQLYLLPPKPKLNPSTLQTLLVGAVNSMN
jgi:hypothetical protein